MALIGYARVSTTRSGHGEGWHSYHDDCQHTPVLAAYDLQSTGADACGSRVGQRAIVPGEQHYFFTLLLRFLYGAVTTSLASFGMLCCVSSP